jgi:hypothetical protein
MSGARIGQLAAVAPPAAAGAGRAAAQPRGGVPPVCTEVVGDVG